MNIHKIFSYLDEKFNSNLDINSVILNFCGNIELSIIEQIIKDNYYIYNIQSKLINKYNNNKLLYVKNYYCRFCNYVFSKGVNYHCSSKKHLKNIEKFKIYFLPICNDNILYEIQLRWTLQIYDIIITPYWF